MTAKNQSGPKLIFVSQIIAPSNYSSDVSKKVVSEVSKDLKQWGFNFAFPIVCLSDEEDKFLLLTGLPIYTSAIESQVNQIWVLLIADERSGAERAIEQLARQSELNERLLDIQDISDFLIFLNDIDSPLTEVRGIGDKYAQKIRSKRPYELPEDMMKKLGPNQSLQWLKAYKQWKFQKQSG